MKKRLHKLFLFATLIIVPCVIQAQSLGLYTFSTGTDTTKWIDMSSSTQIVTLTSNGDRVSAVRNIGFSFPFGTGVYTQYSANTDGNLRLGSTATTTSGYATPFSSTNANVNNPKINFFGTNGYGVVGSHYIKALNTVDSDNDSMLCVEFCIGTYATATRNNLYKWQVHLYPSGNIEIVYGPAPTAPPAASRQPGLCYNSSDGYYVDGSHTANYFTSGTSWGIASGNWPSPGRYYRFVAPAVTCPKPYNMTTSDVSSNSFNVTWSDTSSSTSWIVQLIANSQMVYDSLVSDTLVSFVGLDAATYYTVRVAGLCDNGDTSGFTTATALTECAMVTSLPFTQNFDHVTGTSSTSVSTNNLPPCWWYNNTGITSLYSGYPIVYSSSTYAHSGNNSMRFYTYDTPGTYGDQTAIMPETDSVLLPLTNLQLSFWMRAHTNSYNSNVVVGVMSNPYDISTFVPVETVYTNYSTTYEHHTVFLANYRGPHGRIAIKAPQPTTGYNYLYIDDIVIDVMPNCPPPANVTTANATPGSVDVSWTQYGTANSWTVFYMPTGYTIDSALSALTYDTTLTLYNLDANTDYTIMVVANCGSEGSDTTFATFRTLCEYIVSLPYTESFDSVSGSTSTSVTENNLPPCWMYHNTGSSIDYGNYPIVYSSNESYSDSNALAFYTSTTAGTYSDQIAILPPTDPDILPMSELQLSFWMRSTSNTYNSYIVVGVMTNSTDASTFVEVDTFYTNSSTTYTEHTVLMGRYRGPHGNIALKAPQPTSSYNALLIDDVTIDHLPPCPSVGDISVTHITSDSIGITWFALGTETSWLVSDGNNQYVATDTTFTFGGLMPNTTYTLTVQALCPSMSDTSATMSIVATTECSDLASLPFSENFDSHPGFAATASAENNLPDCWRNINHGTRTNYMGYPIIYNDNSFANSGTNSMRFYSYYSAADSNQYAILPRTDSLIYPINTLTLSFSMRGHSNNVNYMSETIVGVITNPSDTRTFVPIDTVYANGTTSYSPFEISFNHYYGPHGYIALLFRSPRGTSFNYNSGYIDDLVLDVASDCLPVVEVTASYITSNSAFIEWTDTSINSSWYVEYGISGFTPGLGAMLTVYDTSVTLTGLMSNTVYDVYVSPNCPSGLSGTTMTSFRTECGTIDSLPYFENFEGYPVGNSSIAPPECGVPCYRRIDNASQYHFGYIGNPSSFPTGAHSGTGFLYYYMPNSSDTYADWIITVLPPINTTLHPINTLQLSFWTKMNSTTTSGNIVVGVMTDPLQDSTFVPVDTVQVSGNIYDMKQAFLDSYVGTGAYIALKYTRNTSTNTYYFVDDILVETIPACPPVSNIALTSLDTNLLTITWTENGSCTSWIVEYGITGFIHGSGSIDTVSSLPHTITGLVPETYYDIYVTPVCLEGPTVSRSATFRTANRYLSLPLACNFENTTQNTAWVLENGSNTNKWCIGTAANNGGNHSLYISDNNGTSNAYTTSSSTVDYAYVDVSIPTPGDYEYSFDWRCQGEGNYDYLRVALVPFSVTLTAGTTLPTGLNTTSTPTSWIALDGGSKLNLQSDWLTRNDIITVPTAGMYHLAFIFRCDGSGGSTPPPAIDNILLTPIPCARPDSIAISNLTQTTAHFTWSEMGTATEWQYQLDSGSVSSTYSTNTILTGLTANTSYIFRVRAVCGGGDTSAWQTYLFHTPCGSISLPYTQDFESETTSSSSTGSVFVNCWIRLNNGTSSGGYPYVGGSSYNHTSGGSKGLYWYNSTSTGTYGDYLCAVLPPVDTAVDVSTLQLSFWGKSSSATSYPSLQIGVMTDPNNLATFVGVDTVYISGTDWRELQIPLATYAGNGRYIAIKTDRAASSWGVYTDDFTLDYAPSCVVPRHVFATHATTSSLTVDWVDITPAMEWQVEYGEQGFARGTSAGALVTTNIHPVIITGLDTLTNYDFYIRPICAVGDTANWTVQPLATLNTGICDNAVDFTIGSPSSSGTSYQAPVNNYYKYTLTETIIESSEIGGPLDIEYIGYYYNYATAMTDKTNCTIYLQPTTLSTFASSADVEALDSNSAVMVYTGPLNCSLGWNIFPLDTVYNYDGSTNLMVIVDDNSNDYNSNSYTFRTEPCSGNKVLYYYSDSQNPDPATITSSYSGSKGVASWRPVMQLLSCSAPFCHQPEITNISYTYENATITWSGDGTDYEVNIKETDSTDWPATDIHVTDSTYTFTGLLPATSYTLRVRQDCSSSSLGYSEWVINDFTTDNMPCFAPDSLTVTAVTNATATFTWSTSDNDTAWDIHVWYSGFDSVCTVNTYPVIVGGFSAGVTYQASIRAYCGAASNTISDWGDTIVFTTAVCPDVTGLGTRNVTANSVDVYWNPDPMAQQWIIEYGFHGFDLGTGTQVTTTLTTYTINGLMDDMEYDFRVRAVCGDDWQSEGWATTSATTLEGGVPCEAPTAVNAVVAGNAATVSWTANTGNISFVLEYGTRGFALGSGTTVNATASPVTLSNLAYETAYDVYVKANCADNTSSAWSTVASFTTEAQGSEDCDPVTDLAATNVTESAALLTWTPGNSGDEWEVVLTTAAGATVSENSTTERQFQLTDLTPGTAYVAKVRTVCGDGQYSDFASVSFTTNSVGIADVTAPACTIYPNPTSGATTVSVSGISGKVRIAIVDMNGREVTSETLDCSGDCAKTMSVDNLAQGAYFVRITGENANMVRKLIVR